MLPLAPARSSSGVRVSAVDATRRVQRLRAASGPAALVTTSARAAPRATALGARIPTLTRRGARLAAMSVKAGQLAAAPPLDAAPKEAAATTTGLSVAIIGAGVAGLQAARALQKRGVAVTVFESSPDIGGVWRSNYDGYAAQVRYGWFELPEFSWPAELRAAASDKQYPPGPTIQAYLHAYAKKFGLDRLVRTRTPVTQVQHQADGTWAVSYSSEGAAASRAVFSHLIVATGAYGRSFIPDVKDAGSFQGVQLPAASFTSAALAADKDVVVVGGGKSALDIAAAAATTARSVVILRRKVHWPLAPFVGGIIPYEFAAYSRAAKFNAAYYNANVVQSLLHLVFTPVKWFVWRVVELLLRVQFRLTGPLSPDEPIERDVYYTGQIFPNQAFFTGVRRGLIKAVKGVQVAALTKSGVVITGGVEVPAQLIVWATGHRKTYDWADDWTRQRLNLQPDGLPLFRNIVPPEVPGLLFVGGEVTTYNNPLTHALQSEWVASLITGELSLPPKEKQLQDIERLQKWRRSFIPADESRSAKYQLHGNQYHDQLVSDLGHGIFRKPWWTLGIAELLWPTQASDYTKLFRSEKKQAVTAVVPATAATAR